MFRLTSLAACLLLSFAAQSAPLPDFVKIEERDGSLVAAITEIKFRSVVKTVTIVENGQTRTKNVTEIVPIAETAMRIMSAEAGEFFTSTGEKIDPKKLNEVLKKGAVIAVSKDGKPVDPEVLKKHSEVVAAVLVLKNGPVAKVGTEKKPIDDKPFATEAWLNGGSIVIRRDLVSHQQVPRTEERTDKDGKKTTVTVNVQVPVTTREAVTLDPKLTLVLRLDGKTVPPGDWESLLKDKTKVIVSPGGKAIPDELRSANKDVVAVIVIKAK